MMVYKLIVFWYCKDTTGRKKLNGAVDPPREGDEMLLGKVAKCLAISAVACLLATTSLTAWGEETGTPKKGGTLTVGIQDDSQTLDPIASVQWSERQMLFLIFDTLDRKSTRLNSSHPSI